MIQLENISLYFIDKKEYILKDISWHIREGENWVLFGRNGSGKSKLLEIIAGYRSASRGNVIRFNRGQAGTDIRELRKRIGYISTSLKDQFSPHEKIIDILLSGVYASIGLYEDPDSTNREKALRLLDIIGMIQRQSEPFNHFSDGEKQKILLARAIIRDPDILILDEPSMALDLGAREEVLATIERLQEHKRCSVIYVTHHTEEISPLFTKLFILHDSRCLHQGDVSGGINNEMMSEIFRREITVVHMNGRFYSMVN
ncbi:MAG: ATP-binding cassette domain-containing protein [Spirochaetes bacterium]|nr:ATP-binding cassette domain-containing protein [Spirochaetota bacterium]